MGHGLPIRRAAREAVSFLASNKRLWLVPLALFLLILAAVGLYASAASYVPPMYRH